jgi:uncharacterized protein (TIGR03437 family)
MPAVSVAQPFIFTRGIVRATDSIPFGIPNGIIARGSIITIYGRNLGPSPGVQASSYPLSRTLSGVSVVVTDGVTSINAPLVYVSASQVNAILPSQTPLESISVRVVVNNVRSNSVPILVGNNSLGLFTVHGTGAGPAIAYNYISQSQQPLNSLQAAAKPGQVITLWGTGLGPVTADDVAPAAGNLPVTVEVYVGGKSAPVMYAGRSPCCAGTDQIVFQVPSSAPTGCWVPVSVRLAGQIVSNVATMAITKTGSACASGEGSVANTFIQGGKIGLLTPLRSDIEQSAPNSPLELVGDYLAARFGQEKGGAFAFNPLVSLPPAGSCTAYSGSGDWFSTADLPDIAPEVRSLDGGGATVNGGGKAATYQTPYSPLNLGYLGSLNPVNSHDTSLLAPGAFNIQTAGGADVPSFKLPFTMISPLTWTNREQLTTLDRAAGFTVNWSGGAGNTIAVVGGSVDLPTNASAVFVCMPAPGSTSLTVPPLILSNLPQGRGDPRYGKGVVFLVEAAPSKIFQTQGLDHGLIAPLYLAGRAVEVQ